MAVTGKAQNGCTRKKGADLLCKVPRWWRTIHHLQTEQHLCGNHRKERKETLPRPSSCSTGVSSEDRDWSWACHVRAAGRRRPEGTMCQQCLGSLTGQEGRRAGSCDAWPRPVWSSRKSGLKDSTHLASCALATAQVTSQNVTLLVETSIHGVK